MNPNILFAIVDPNGKIFLKFDSQLIWSQFEPGDFVVRFDGVVQTIYVDYAAFDTLILKTAAPIERSETRSIDVQYDQSAGLSDSIKDATWYEPVRSFTSYSIPNNSQVAPLEVLSITRVDVSPSNAATLYYRVVFSESVASYTVDSSDFQLTLTGTASGQIGRPESTDGGLTWLVPVENISGTGSFKLDLKWFGTGITSSFIPAGFTSPKTINSGYTLGEYYEVDRDAPNTYATSLSLSADTGSSDVDNITNVPNQIISGTLNTNLSYGESVLVSFDNGGSWTTALGSSGQNNWSINTVLSEGLNWISIKVADAIGNTGTIYNAYVWLDTIPPATTSAPALDSGSDTGLSGSDGVTSSTSLVVYGTSGSLQTITIFDTDGSTVLASGQAGYEGTWSFTLTGLSEGTHLITAKQSDNAGNFSAASDALAVTVDTFVPLYPSALALASASVTGIFSSVTSDTTPTITGYAESGTTVILYDSDGTTLLGTTIASGGAWSVTSSVLSEGVHTLTAKSVDVAGNVSEASSAFEVTIDTTMPIVWISSLWLSADTGSTNSDWETNVASQTITMTTSRDLYPDESIFVSLDNAVTWSAVDTSSSLFGFTADVELFEGSNSIYLKVVDQAGNYFQQARVPYVLDVTPPPQPNAPILSLTNDTGWSNTDYVTSSTSLVLSGTSSRFSMVRLYDSDGSTVLASGMADVNGAWTLTTTALDDGIHLLSAKVSDLAGNWSVASDRLSVLIDTISPSVISFVPTNGVTDVPVNAEVRVRFSEALVSSSNLANVYLKNALDTVIATTTQIDQNGELLILPSVSLEHGTTYTVTWDANTLYDLAGNSVSTLDRATALTFTTVEGSNDVSEGEDGLDTIELPPPLPERTDFDLVPPVQFRSFINGVETSIQPTFFTGPSSLNLHYQVIDTTPDAVIVGSTLNDFIVLQGDGNKAVDGGLGDDVIDGGTGSTFMSGGGGSNTFFLDGRASGVSWSTITDFQLGGGDKATIWGWKEGVSRVKEVVENGGATGYTGLTLHFEHLLPDGSESTARNSSLNSITFSNKSLSDFGANSVTDLNQQIIAGTNSHFVVGQTNDQYGEHGYLFIS